MKYEIFGDLIKIDGSIIHVRCHVVREKTKNPHVICEKCYWHNHPDRAKGKLLHCNCRRAK